MTVMSQVKQCLASLRGVQADLQHFALHAQTDDEQRTFHESMLVCHEVVTKLQKRVYELEQEEPQYKSE